MEVAVKILRYIDDGQSGWVEAELMDAGQRRHIFRDKLPLFTGASLRADSPYPQPGWITCQIVSRAVDGEGRETATISTAMPFHMESVDGRSEFVVFSGQLSPAPPRREH